MENHGCRMVFVVGGWPEKTCSPDYLVCAAAFCGSEGGGRGGRPTRQVMYTDTLTEEVSHYILTPSGPRKDNDVSCHIA